MVLFIASQPDRQRFDRVGRKREAQLSFGVGSLRFCDEGLPLPLGGDGEQAACIRLPMHLAWPETLRLDDKTAALALLA